MTKLHYLITTIKNYFHPPKKYTPSTSLRSRKHWSPTEITDLLHMHEHHMPISQIADELDRPISGVRSKLISLGYSTKGGN